MLVVAPSAALMEWEAVEVEAGDVEALVAEALVVAAALEVAQVHLAEWMAWAALELAEGSQGVVLAVVAMMVVGMGAAVAAAALGLEMAAVRAVMVAADRVVTMMDVVQANLVTVVLRRDKRAMVITAGTVAKRKLVDDPAVLGMGCTERSRD